MWYDSFLSCEHVYVRARSRDDRPRPRVVPVLLPSRSRFAHPVALPAHASSGDALPGEIGVKGTPSCAAYRLRSSSYFSSTPACSW